MFVKHTKDHMMNGRTSTICTGHLGRRWPFVSSCRVASVEGPMPVWVVHMNFLRIDPDDRPCKMFERNGPVIE